ncbi:uncharacterized protein LAESUDRAFT_681043 [Laetiporus sulphureus 93-53]|uniref:CUE domain-containing protein n=1 Tax=Laetiporus sulphureus 93-53 TaxID=1314785 RepID=A0A165DSZ4_9APHY|nr:uncharacterized protein LAESUDRAFT_681043 [Laetiporus sulphureus 93-53]KZT05568.1 hypothetical protein LAESUDRAFT_681043 [Laetiporus sulphureus 93-53]
MSLENAPVSKGLMIGIALTSIAVGIFDVKHYMHLQIVPHISKYHQYWRLFAHHVACANSSDLFLIELLLYNVGVQIERSFGSAKFSSFIVVAMLTSTITTFLSLLVLQASRTTGAIFNDIPSGPIAMMFSILYQYARLVPQAYQMKIFGVDLSDKIWVYLVAGQLAITRFPASLLPTALGLLSGYLYRSDFLQLKSWRIPHRVQTFAQKWIAPLLGEERPIRRSNRVLPESRSRRRTDRPTLGEDEVVTTARRPRAPTNPAESFRARGASAAQRESDIQMLMSMFPGVTREVVTDVLQRSPTVEAAAAILFSSQT